MPADTRAISNATPMTRLVSASHSKPCRNGVIGMSDQDRGCGCPRTKYRSSSASWRGTAFAIGFPVAVTDDELRPCRGARCGARGPPCSTRYGCASRSSGMRPTHIGGMPTAKEKTASSPMRRPAHLRKRQQGTSDPTSVYWYLSSDPTPAILIFKAGQ